ncbi:MAG TPA: DUF1800 family protein [Candidatus Dormibacteraeota bacterium]|nr:DUF1800 family protein [Candidatus Dormibacteraeota bacterium]
MNAHISFKRGISAVLLSIAMAGCSTMGGGNTTPPPAPGQLVVTPGSAMVRGAETQQFSAQVTGDTTATAVAWSVNGVAGGNSTTGTITSGGLFTAPEFPPSTNSITITATETADSTKTASSSITLENPTPQISSISPTSIPVGSFKLTINGSHFASNAVVDFGSTALTTTRVSSTQLTATGTASGGQVGNISISVKNPDPGTISSGTMTAKVVNGSGVNISLTPATATVHATDVQYFTATVTGAADSSVQWAVNNGSGTVVIGYITAQGGYTAPNSIPNPNTVTITATSKVDPTQVASSIVTIVNPTPVVASINPTNIATGSFLLTVTGKGFMQGSVINFGGQALPTLYVSPTELDAIGSAATTGNVQVTVTNPNPGGSTSGSLTAQVVGGTSAVTQTAAVRFLEQSSFGPTPETVNQVSQLGFDNYLASQFAAPVSTYPNPGVNDSVSNVQNSFFLNDVNDGDQLRLRVAFALNEQWVVSANKVSDPNGYTNYMRALTNDALGNYYDVMKDVTLTPAMGHFLDMVNNDKPGTGQHANENYARELMQLFTLGLSQTNPDGTPMLDGSGNPIPTYTQDDVMALGRSLTGWTFPTQPGMTLQKHNPEYYGGPMLPFESNHDNGTKTFLGQSVAAGQTAEAELDNVLTTIFNHPNMPPFVARSLILKLVSSNPSPAYVQRVANAFISGKFNSYGSGKRGDMQATVAAVLLDSEARRGDSNATADPNDGKLREPAVMIVSVARAFHGQTADGSQFVSPSSNMSQNVFNSGSVFNFFPPDSPIPQSTLNGPEFAIFNTNTSLARVNFINSAVYGGFSSSLKLDFTPVINAGTPDQMVALLDTLFLHNTISDPMKQGILTAIGAVSSTDTKNQAKTAIYLVLSSSQYQVQR